MTVADRIIEHLSRPFSDLTPMEIAEGLNLNANTVRRTTRELALSGEIVEQSRYRGAPVYVIAPVAYTPSEPLVAQ